MGKDVGVKIYDYRDVKANLSMSCATDRQSKGRDEGFCHYGSCR